MLVTYKDKNLRYKQITQRPPKEESKKLDIFKPKKIYILPDDYPWRRFKLPGSLNFEEKEEVLAGAL